MHAYIHVHAYTYKAHSTIICISTKSLVGGGGGGGMVWIGRWRGCDLWVLGAPGHIDTADMHTLTYTHVHVHMYTHTNA